jgi:uncharacterized protein (TIGR01777 family)
MKVIVTGSTGLIGRALCNKLAQQHSVVALTRRPEIASGLLDKAVEIVKWDARTCSPWDKSIDDSDAIVHLAGANVAVGRWTGNRKAEILDSRISSNAILIDAIKASISKPEVVILASAIGFYGDSGDKILYEESGCGSNFPAQVCKETESYRKDFKALGIRTIVIRTAMVLDPQGGALPKLMLPFRFYLGGHWSSGNQWMSWISLNDELSAIEFLIRNNSLSGTFNLSSPHPLRNHVFFKILASVLKKPCRLVIPSVAMKMVFGQMASELFLVSQRVYPKRLEEAGFEFEHSDLETALRSIGVGGTEDTE